ncbi:hypothetical protein ANCCAN_28783, partial [Ancylostoma caninum]
LIPDEQVHCPAGQLQRCISTDSLDSAASSIIEVNRDVPMANMTLKYDESLFSFNFTQVGINQQA